MSRRYLAVPVLLALAAMPALASEGGDADAIRNSLERMTPRAGLAQLFARLNDGREVVTADGVNLRHDAMEVVVARLGTDGKVVTSCVNTLEAAEHFFSVPVKKLGNGKASAE
jgi:hypothetical protein